MSAVLPVQVLERRFVQAVCHGLRRSSRLLIGRCSLLAPVDRLELCRTPVTPGGVCRRWTVIPAFAGHPGIPASCWLAGILFVPRYAVGHPCHRTLGWASPNLGAVRSCAPRAACIPHERRHPFPSRRLVLPAVRAPASCAGRRSVAAFRAMRLPERSRLS